MFSRPTRQSDIPALQSILDETELFPSALLAELLDGFLSGGADSSGDLWITVEIPDEGRGGQVLMAVGFCYAAPEKLADGAWNMLAIAVAPAAQGRGVGAMLVAGLETELRGRNQRLLIADTSGTAQFSATRAFYVAHGYVEEARIRDFWGPGDDKVVYWKALS